jgi:urocanate hydratase
MVNHKSNALTIVIRMLVGELSRRVRRKPTKPVVFTGAGRSATRSWRTKADGVVSLINPYSG